MICRRCDGLMVEEFAGVNPVAKFRPIHLWRCLNCGARWDWVIAVNQWRSRPPASVVAQRLLAELFAESPSGRTHRGRQNPVRL